MDILVKKLLDFALVLFLSVSSVFFVIRMAPGDPVEKILGPRATLEERAELRKNLKLDQPISLQYLSFLSGVVQLDFGDSLFKKDKVIDLVKKRIKPSLILGLISVSLSFFLGSLLGVYLAIRKGSFWDLGFRIISLFGLAFPIFSLAPLLVYLFSIKLGWFPVSEWGTPKHMFLPILTLTIPLTTILIRVVRTRFLDDLGEPFVQVLKSKGLSDKAIFLRIFKLTLPTILNVVAIQLSVVLGGTIITETIFDIPGMGLLLFDSIQGRDYPLVQGIITFVALIYMSVYFIIEWINESIDPRLRHEE